MKIIDLYNKIANREKVPKKIEKLETYKISSANHYDNESTLLKKLNEIIDYINSKEE